MLLSGTSVLIGATPATPVAQASAPDFGSPPSGQIPILYNDRHVYTKPDVLKAGRVLAAYAKDGTIYLPLRSMFEQMGATVSFDASGRTATVTKPGATIVVTVGKPIVVINGESRPLDVPPIVYQGVVLVPVRVISESMGAYVQWVPDRRLVVVRYVEPTPPPTEAPPAPERDGRAASSSAADTQSADDRRILPFVLLHASERVEQSWNAVRFCPRRQVQQQRGQSGDVE